MNFLLVVSMGIASPVVSHFNTVEEVCKAYFNEVNQAFVYERFADPTDLNKDVWLPKNCKDPEVVQPPLPPPYVKYEVENVK